MSAHLSWTWPTDEQAIDLAHKAVYAFAVGPTADSARSEPRTVGWRRRAQ